MAGICSHSCTQSGAKSIGSPVFPEILRTFLKLNPQYLTYFNVDLKKYVVF